MPRNMISIQQLGRDVCWMLIQQAIGMPDVKMNSNFMDDKVAVLLFARLSLPERLCCTAAIRQMGGTTIYAGDSASSEWRGNDSPIQSHLLPIFGYYMDCMYIYGIPVSAENVEEANLRFPVINAGGIDKHPAHAMADLACMLQKTDQIDKITAAWIGGENGTLYSLIELMAWFRFGLKISMPKYIDTGRLKARVAALNARVEFVSTPEEAVRGAQFIYAGRREGKTPETESEWKITQSLLAGAQKNAKLLLSASPIRAIYIEPQVLNSKTSLLTQQAQMRLGIHKRILHWVFSS